MATYPSPAASAAPTDAPTAPAATSVSEAGASAAPLDPSPLEEQPGHTRYEGGCHCGAVRLQVLVPDDKHQLLDCNCSMCSKKGALHLITPPSHFRLTQGQEQLSLYTFGTHQAKHLFCSRCGIAPFYRPRSHPDDYSVNLLALDQYHDIKGKFTLVPYDGRNWEKARAKLSEVEAGTAAAAPAAAVSSEAGTAAVAATASPTVDTSTTASGDDADAASLAAVSSPRESDPARLEALLNPAMLDITDTARWESDAVGSWALALRYLEYVERHLAELDADADAQLLRHAAAAYLRINYRLLDAADPHAQSATIRRFEPLLASALSRGLLPLTSLWHEKLEAIYPVIHRDDRDGGSEEVQVMNSDKSQPKFLTRLPSAYDGRQGRLWVGGERADPHEHANHYLLNCDPSMLPDMLADASNACHFMVLPSASFPQVYFDHLGYAILTQQMLGDVLAQLGRIQPPGGVLEFRSEHASHEYYTRLIEQGVERQITDRLEACDYRRTKFALQEDEECEFEHRWFMHIVAEKK